MTVGDPLPLPLGFQRFHRTAFINSQLNRAHSLGPADADDLRRGAARVSRPGDVPAVFEEIAEQAASQRRHRAAIGAMRIAEFFTPGRDRRKHRRYGRFREMVDLAFPDLAAARVDIAYRDGFLPAYHLPGGTGGRYSSTADSTR